MPNACWGLWGSGTSVWVVCDRGVVLRHGSGGWETERQGSDPALLAVWGSGPGDIWAVGSGGAIFHRSAE